MGGHRQKVWGRKSPNAVEGQGHGWGLGQDPKRHIHLYRQCAADKRYRTVIKQHGFVAESC